jgi:hypothetical protein
MGIYGRFCGVGRMDEQVKGVGICKCEGLILFLVVQEDIESCVYHNINI